MAQTESRRSVRLAPGDVIAEKYRVEREIGEGGMGVVYAAHHLLLDLEVALKLLTDDSDPAAVARFLEEPRKVAQLHSDHVVRVMDMGRTADGHPFIVMELLEGKDLSKLLDTRGPLPVAEAVDYVLQALHALALAHGSGIIHRDLKPSNLFLANLSDGTQRIKVLDFGVSKSISVRDSAASLTGAGALLGSPAYMPPEQIRAPRSVDARSDIWAIGVVLYELVTDKSPFEAYDIGQLFARILEGEPTPVRDCRPEVATALANAIMRCLAHDRDDRFANVAELAAAIAPFGSGAHTSLVARIGKAFAHAAGSGRRLGQDRASVPDFPEPSSRKEIEGARTQAAISEPQPRVVSIPAEASSDPLAATRSYKEGVLSTANSLLHARKASPTDTAGGVTGSKRPPDGVLRPTLPSGRRRGIAPVAWAAAALGIAGVLLAITRSAPAPAPAAPRVEAPASEAAPARAKLTVRVDPVFATVTVDDVLLPASTSAPATFLGDFPQRASAVLRIAAPGFVDHVETIALDATTRSYDVRLAPKAATVDGSDASPAAVDPARHGAPPRSGRSSAVVKGDKGDNRADPSVPAVVTPTAPSATPAPSPAPASPAASASRTRAIDSQNPFATKP